MKAEHAAKGKTLTDAELDAEVRPFKLLWDSHIGIWVFDGI